MINCPHCGVPNQDADLYCSVCKNNLKSPPVYILNNPPKTNNLMLNGFLQSLGITAAIPTGCCCGCFGLIILCVLFFAVIGGGMRTQTPREPSSINLNVQDNFTIPRSNYSYDSKSKYIEGVIKNGTSKRYNGVHIEIYLYKNNKYVGNTYADVYNMSPYGNLNFKAYITVDDFDKYEVHRISGT